MSELTAEEKLFAVRAENQKIMEKIMLLENKIEQLKKIKKVRKD